MAFIILVYLQRGRDLGTVTAVIGGLGENVPAPENMIIVNVAGNETETVIGRGNGSVRKTGVWS